MRRKREGKTFKKSLAAGERGLTAQQLVIVAGETYHSTSEKKKKYKLLFEQNYIASLESSSSLAYCLRKTIIRGRP